MGTLAGFAVVYAAITAIQINNLKKEHMNPIDRKDYKIHCTNSNFNTAAHIHPYLSQLDTYQTSQSLFAERCLLLSGLFLIIGSVLGGLQIGGINGVTASAVTLGSLTLGSFVCGLLAKMKYSKLQEDRTFLVQNFKTEDVFKYLLTRFKDNPYDTQAISVIKNVVGLSFLIDFLADPKTWKKHLPETAEPLGTIDQTVRDAFTQIVKRLDSNPEWSLSQPNTANRELFCYVTYLKGERTSIPSTFFFGSFS